MDCYCGCGTKVPGKLAEVNIRLGQTALDLLAWDKHRANSRLDPIDAVEIDRLIERGATCHHRMLMVIHGERDRPSFDEAEEWLTESHEHWRSRPDMIDRGSMLKAATLRVSDDDLMHLDRLHPERSFSGGTPAAAASAAAVQLERLGALRAEGILTEEEFRAAQERLLERESNR